MTRLDARPRGERHGNAKLTAEDVRLLRALRADGATLAELGRRFGVSEKTCSEIALRRAWRHVT